ncbi:MAG: FmdB family zinc ribbon protein [Ignavibacteriaceae bacterium]|jgi:putative FmdB family regulatory protein
MPTYQYKCKKCGHLFEVFHSMSAEPIKICPKCKGPVKRLIGPGAGPIFKGSGFYQTDYKNKENAPTPKKPSKDTAEKK